MDHAVVARYARSHHGVFTQSYLDTLGLDASRAAREVKAGRWRRLHEGVFAGAPTPDSFELLAEAALAALPAATLGLRAAAKVHRIDAGAGELDLIVEPGGRNRLRGTRIHQAPLPPRHVVRRGGWRVTAVERTLIDLGKVVSASVLQRCIEDSVIGRLTTMARVETVFGEQAVRGRAGIGRCRKVLALLDGSPPTESELEAMFVRALRRLRRPEPVRQVRFDWSQAVSGRVDFWYPAERVIVELDGRRFHLRVAAFESDRRRDLLALAEGIVTVRITHRQLMTELSEVMSALGDLLGSRDPRAANFGLSGEHDPR